MSGSRRHMSRRTARAGTGVAAAAVALALALTLLGGGVDVPRFSGIEDLPLPGGADLGDHPYEVTAEFRDVLSLVPQSAVKVNDVSVGRVTKISLAEKGWTAKVTMRVNGDVELPAEPYARIEQSSLLGEKYVQILAPPKGAGRGTTGKGPDSGGAADRRVSAAESVASRRGRTHIPLSRTNRNPEVEEVLGALSLLLNGGGVNQLKTITTELNKALDGNEPEVRSMLGRVDKLVGSLDRHKGDITQALDGVNRLSATLAARKKSIGTVLTDVSPGLTTLEDQRGQLMTMLRSLDSLSKVAVSTVNRSKDDIVADLKALAPTLRRLADAGQDLPDSLQVLFTYPFTDEVLRGVKGDYLNLYLNLTAQPGTILTPPLKEEPIPQDPGPATGAAGGTGDTAALPLPAVTTPPDAGGDR
ncbi:MULTISPECIES: MlaD family protein [unclassified Streptomyces]|uniref:MlaD family protein n=1 Tax=unclassified Streptomyces TaxID=2593676 RepID=UPI002DD9B80A|nr:MlaD family protein [Streptomyces sp. NBC_01775]WSB75322.1 MlaD family protein [Streptomyces sp. NBC_01775]WSS45213.1 MlaD family protein [Streptomyces sp. NBC_01187]